MVDVKQLRYQYPIFEDYIEPKGALAINKESHACFYYTMLATRARALAGTGIESQIIEYKVGETPPEWKESRDEELARSVAILYGLESPDAFLKKPWRMRAWTQAKLLGIDVPIVIYDVRPGAPKLQ
jgi:hypothetical protein